MMLIVYFGMVVAGLAAIVWGLPAAHRLKCPFDILAALVALAGLIAALIGTLLIAVPGFFLA
jgi:hypothetical protein